ncbi:MAG: hypothetical protein OEV57_00875 [Dehalococcoidia bacterium]|nr:hypothetical protein [Dehalococcoidia bacterium]
MKAIVRRLIKEEGGQALLLAVILLLVAGLAVASLLSFMGTGLRLNPVYEGRVAELYAADAGVEDAVWKIQHPLQAGYLPCSVGNPPREYNITDINGRFVKVTIEYVSAGVYNVTSIAVTFDGGNTAAIDSATEVNAYVTPTNLYGNYSGLLDHIVTTQGIIDEQGKQYLNYTTENAPVEGYIGAWPTAAELAEFYWQDVRNAVPYSSSTLDVKDHTATGIGPFYRNGTFNDKGIINTGSDGLTLTLNGTVYITGDTEIGTTSNNEFVLDLNSNTIFVSSNTSGSQKALSIGTKVSIKGPGCIIAVGDIYFEPKSQVTTDPVFVLSVAGQTLLQPRGDIYGAIAGSVEVQLQPNTHLVYPTGGFGGYGLNFLVGTQKLIYSIASWQVTPLSRNDFGE